MGTSNFARPSNAGKYYTVLTNRTEEIKTCSECGEIHREWEHGNLAILKKCTNCEIDISEIEIEFEEIVPDEYEYIDLMDSIEERILEHKGFVKREHGNDRNYPITKIGYLESSKTYLGVDIDVRCYIVIQSAYYEGATLDYLITVLVNGDEFNYSTGSRYDNGMEDVLNEITYMQSNYKQGLINIMRPKAERFITESIQQLSSISEGILEASSDLKLNCLGIFSNGEAVYEKTN